MKLIKRYLPGILIFLSIALLVGVVFFSMPHRPKAEPPNYDQHNYNRQSPHQVQQESKRDDLITQTVNIILAQGFSGAIIVVLFGYIWKEGKNNRAVQKENFDKFVDISAECSGHMASVSARLENIEREIESSKQIQMLSNRNG